jgi:pentatricopeptide repeat protein
MLLPVVGSAASPHHLGYFAGTTRLPSSTEFVSQGGGVACQWRASRRIGGPSRAGLETVQQDQSSSPSSSSSSSSVNYRDVQEVPPMLLLQEGSSSSDSSSSSSRSSSSVDTSSSSSEQLGFSAAENSSSVESVMMNSSSRTTRRDVWVNPRGSAFRTQDLLKNSERKEEQSTTLNKYLWVSPDRKVQPGKISWAERRAAILDLQTAEDVAAALSRVGDSLETMDLNAVLRQFGRLRRWEDACVLFDWMKEREKLSAPTYTSFFSVLGKAGRAERALYIFNELPVLDPVRCNVFVCNSILSTLVYNGKVDKALRLFEQMKVDGLQPDLITYSTVNSKYRHHFYTKHFSTSLQDHRLQLCSLLGAFSVVHK